MYPKSTFPSSRDIPACPDDKRRRREAVFLHWKSRFERHQIGCPPPSQLSRDSRDLTGNFFPIGILTGLTVIDVRFTAAPCETRFAHAAVAPVGVLARGAVPTGALDALVDVNLTSLA